MKLYFMGICGTAMGNVALLLRELGFDVSGTDVGIYPPMSDLLRNADVEMFGGYDVERLKTLNPDRVVVGNVISRGNPEVEWLWETRSFPCVSLPALLGELLLSKRKNLVVTGTHGKTTTSTLAAYLLQANGFETGYLIGGVPLDLPAGSQAGVDAGPFVIEGDEYDSAFFDKRSKFIHYLPQVVTLNNLEFDHADIFRDLADVSRSFNHLLRLVPRNGYVVANGDDDNIAALDEAPWTQMIRVGAGEHNDLVIAGFSETQATTNFKLIWRGQLWAEVTWQLPGFYNARNAAMAALSAGLLMFPDDPTQLKLDALSAFRGVKRRQEQLYSNGQLEVFEDFGHHPTAIEQTLVSFRNRFPDAELIACFEPRSNTARTRVFQDDFAKALSKADRVFIGPVDRIEKLAEGNRLDTAAMAECLCREGVVTTAADSCEGLLGSLKESLAQSNEKRLVCFFSNGAFGGIIQKFVDAVKG